MGKYSEFMEKIVGKTNLLPIATLKNKAEFNDFLKKNNLTINEVVGINKYSFLGIYTNADYDYCKAKDVESIKKRLAELRKQREVFLQDDDNLIDALAEAFRDYDVRELDYKKNILLICGDLFIRYEDKIELIEKAYEVYEMEVYE